MNERRRGLFSETGDIVHTLNERSFVCRAECAGLAPHLVPHAIAGAATILIIVVISLFSPFFVLKLSSTAEEFCAYFWVGISPAGLRQAVSEQL